MIHHRLRGLQKTTSVNVADVFATSLYTGNGSNQTITNGINLSGEGGLVWIKRRSGDEEHLLVDTMRGVNRYLASNSTQSESTVANTVTAFNGNGFSAGSVIGLSNETYVAFTFRQATKFFDVVTYTGNGTDQRNINHSLGTEPGIVIIKRTDSTSNWFVMHRAFGGNYYLRLNTTDSQQDPGSTVNPNSTVFKVSDTAISDAASRTNVLNATYVAYLFAHDPDGVIQCGSYTGNGSTTGPTVTLGWEPQYLMIKKVTDSGNPRSWWVADSARGISVGAGGAFLCPNSSSAESAGWDFISTSSSGFQLTTTDDNFNTSGITYIYMAIKKAA